MSLQKILTSLKLLHFYPLFLKKGMINAPSVDKLGGILEGILSTGMVKRLLKSASCFCKNKPVPCLSHHKIKGVRDEAIDHLHRLLRHIRRPVADLESQGEQRARVQPAGPGHRIRKDGETTREEPHLCRVSAVIHHLVH